MKKAIINPNVTFLGKLLTKAENLLHLLFYIPTLGVNHVFDFLSFQLKKDTKRCTVVTLVEIYKNLTDDRNTFQVLPSTNKNMPVIISLN